MSVHEPMTMATDYLLAILAAVFAVRLWPKQRAWALAFLFTALGSFLGGSYHGFFPQPWLWKMTVFSIGLASFFLLLPLFPRLALLKFMVYAIWMIGHDAFRFVIMDYGLTLFLVGVDQAVRWKGERSRSAPWILAGIAVAVLAALVQMLRIAPHRHFNHNDLYHLIQAVSLWLLYRGGLLLRTSWREPVTSPPR